MKKPYIICHMMISLDGRIDCAMTEHLPGVDDYYQTLEALSGLENLAALSLRNYNIRDLSGLEGAHALQNLYIETQNQLTDISALRDLEHLTNVTLIFDGDENRISDMSPLDHVPNVTVE